MLTEPAWARTIVAFFEQAAAALQFLLVDRYAQAWFFGSPPP
jgi:hypothetical protein